MERGDKREGGAREGGEEMDFMIGMLQDTSMAKSKEIQIEIIKLLAEKNCTVKESKYILSQVSRYIDSFSTVQFSGMPDYEL